MEHAQGLKNVHACKRTYVGAHRSQIQTSRSYIHADHTDYTSYRSYTLYIIDHAQNVDRSYVQNICTDIHTHISYI